MRCQICFHPRPYGLVHHICLPQTCINCFLPKDIYDMYCFKCKTSTPCFFCTMPSVHRYQGLLLCHKHIIKSYECEVQLRHLERLDYNHKYEQSVLKQRRERIQKFGRPRLVKRKVIDVNVKEFDSFEEGMKYYNTCTK